MSGLRLSVVVGLLLLAGCSSPPVPPSPPPPAPAPPPPSPVAAVDRFLVADAPASKTYPNSWTILTNIGYESAYDETYRTPVWVAYHLTGTAGTPPPRPSIGYPTDTRSTSLVSQTDFPTGYDHGHMAPNEAIATFYGAAAQNETFLMTNMVPQRPGLNRGPWKSVETLEYTVWEQEFHDVWVICGPVFTTADDQPVVPADRYGAKQVSVPVACFKIEMRKDATGQVQVLAFIMPQDPGTGHSPKEYLTSIREVERRTGLNFFSTWPQAQQDTMETRVAADVWR